ncbi:MAG: ribonuclease T2 [Bryobacterales bacterium]|nr:ribonuclease T2 [Bryobacterales bacterium]
MLRSSTSLILHVAALIAFTFTGVTLGCGSPGDGEPSSDTEAALHSTAFPEAHPVPEDQVVVLEEGANQAASIPTSSAAFDYYVLALSWSPQHCATPAGNRDSTQCMGPRPFGFIVHGLWPQYERGWPEDCGGGPSLSPTTIRSMMDIMPSERLIRHEWRKHGTCSGLAPNDYFALTRKAFSVFQTPSGYGTPESAINVKPASYKQAILDANPSLNARTIAVICSGRFLQEVRICLDKNLQARPCGSGVRDRCNVPEMIVRPLR